MTKCSAFPTTTVQCVPISAFHFSREFFAVLPEDAPFEWGYNDHTLVTPSRIVQHLTSHWPEEFWHAEVTLLNAYAVGHPGVYIDLEN